MGGGFRNGGVTSLPVNFIEKEHISPVSFIQDDLSDCALHQDLTVTSVTWDVCLWYSWHLCALGAVSVESYLILCEAVNDEQGCFNDAA